MRDTVEFRPSAAQLRGGIIASALFGLFFLLFGILYPDAVARWFCLGIAAIAAYAFIRGVMLSFDKRPVLSIGPDGLMYRWFCGRTVPWSEVTAISVIRAFGYGVMMKNGVFVTGALVPNKTDVHLRKEDLINFALADYRAYPNGPGRAMMRWFNASMGFPPISIQVSTVAATNEEIVEAIRRYWPGEIAMRDVKRPGR